MEVVIDSEGNDLHPFCNKIWVVCALDLNTNEVKSYRDRESLIEAAKNWQTIIAHNLLGYDLLALLRVWGINFTVGPDTFNGRSVQFIDTLCWSRYLWSDRTWGHSLLDWGVHLNIPKGDFHDWSKYSVEMEQYCAQDTRVCAAIYKELLKERDE